MRPEARLDSAVFQLTPTRTRCELVLIANGKTEKIASGLLNPFLAHLKTAQDQIAKGGYSITLEPDPEIDASWFTKGTVERFVRFVSTPEVLERVTTIESEILQIEEAIAIQSNDNLGLKSVEDHQGKLAEGTEVGSKSSYDPDADKAIVLYKPGSQPHPPVQNETTTQEENSKVQLLRVLETRKTVLRKEQAMAFARAIAAGFNMDNLGYLITFAECFGASRLMKACAQFVELWKRKHETGQWIEVEAAEAMSSRSEFPPFNATGIVFMGDSMKQNMEVSNGDANIEDGKADQKAGTNPQQPGGPHEYFQGPYHQGAYPPWAMHPLPGAHAFQPYPMPYYQNYPGAGPYFPPYPPMDDPRYHHSERKASRRHSSDSKDNGDSESWEDGSDQSSSDKEGSHGRKSHKRGGRKGKKKPGVVVIRNLNYVTSKKHGSSGSESQSGTDVESKGDSTDSLSKSRERKHKRSSSSKKKEGRKIIVESADEYSKDGEAYGQEPDQGNWQAFQSFLLRAEEKTRADDDDLFSGEKALPTKRKENRSQADPIVLSERDSGSVDDRRTLGFDSANGRTRVRQIVSNDEFMMSGEGRGSMHSDLKEIEAGGGGYRRATSDDFMVYGHESQLDSRRSLDPLAENEFERSNNMDKNLHPVTDESFMIPVRSSLQDNPGPESRTAIDIDIEFPSTVQKTSDSSANAGTQLFYEPDVMPDRACESVSFGYDPAMDYDNQIALETAKKVEDENVEDDSTNIKEEVKKPQKDKKLRTSQNGLDKRRMDALTRRLSAPKTSPLTEAQKRAQNLRAFKADLQKVKKEQEEEQIRRLERLKLERQKRIAARSGSVNGINSTSTPQQAKARVAPKISPNSYKGSKFSDSEPGSSSPLKKLPSRTTSGGSDPQKATKASRLSDTTNGLSKSISSLYEVKKEKNGTPESAGKSVQPKRLSDPKGSAADRASNPKSTSNDQVRRSSIPNESQTKKISAIMQLDQRKSATLPELKVKSEEAPSSRVQYEAATKEKKQEGPGAKATPASVSVDGKRMDDKAPRITNSDDNVVIEKTVVMLENEVVSTTPFTLAPGNNVKDESCSGDRKEKPALESEYAALRAPPSPVVTEAANPTISRPNDQLNSYEVVVEYSEEETRKSNSAPTEKPYEAPLARVTSLEDTGAKDPVYPQSLPVHGSGTLMHIESIRARIPETVDVVSVEEAHEANEKPRVKESKGFRKLLKFGRKSHTSAEGSADSDASSVDESTMAAIPSNDGSMLKNLISQDDHQAGGAPTKASRPFSLLSPFRSKHSEKKIVV